jgi:hypothetical protein
MSDTNSIDEIAATINADAARLAGLVDERIHAAAQSQRLSTMSIGNPFGHDDPTEEERERAREQQQRYERDEETARAMAEHVVAIRAAATELQRLESDVRARTLVRPWG